MRTLMGSGKILTTDDADCTDQESIYRNGRKGRNGKSRKENLSALLPRRLT